MSIFALPDLGEGLQEAELVSWHVAEGDRVVADQPLVSVETEKAVVEIPSPQSGRVAHLLAQPGEHVKVGAPLLTFDDEPRDDPGGVVGELAPPPSPAAATRPTAAPTAAPAARARIVAAPAVRALAQRRGIDLALVRGSGPGGAITREDVEEAAPGNGAGDAEPLRGVRRAMAVNMARAHAEVVPATVWDEAEIEAWWAPHADVTLRLVRAIAAACVAVPALNAWYDGAAMTRRLLPQIDLGVAVDTEYGLIVPVLRDIGSRDFASLRRDFETLKNATRNRTVAGSELRDPTITLSNFGMIAGRQAALVVVPPQVAIIGAGRIGLAPVATGESVRFGHVLPLSLTFDHRVVTGGEAARFLRALIEDLRPAA